MEKEFRNITVTEEHARNIRIHNHLTQKEFGELLGISKSYVSDIENGYTGLSIEHINIICNSYNVSFDYMFGFCEKINRNIIKVEKIDLKLLGSHLKEIRKELNITQDKMAQKLNISRPLVTHYEKGIRTISTADLKQICETFGVSADYIVGNIDINIKRDKKSKLKGMNKYE